ncbi:MAG: hypothetical protein K0S32_1028 [Bacteroidetes bacterium]|jgi:hypothetical protein|nr:hypothetical protein [Bacteroidota bacterium]
MNNSLTRSLLRSDFWIYEHVRCLDAIDFVGLRHTDNSYTQVDNKVSDFVNLRNANLIAHLPPPLIPSNEPG